jgi:DNA polymerase-1
VQGSAADIVMMAMIKLWKSETLRALGWKLLLQIHDEVILEGPKESLDQVR